MNTICIVSYAKYMENKKLGKYIDSFDKVIRINNGINILNKEDLGSKTDIVSLSFNEGKMRMIVKSYNFLNKTKFDEIFDILLKENIKNILFVDFIYKYKFPQLKEYNIITNSGKYIDIFSIITTGLSTIICALKMEHKKLFVCGFDFTMSLYKGYDDLYKMIRKHVNRLNKTYEECLENWHSTELERYLFKKLWINYNFEIDDDLSKILDNFETVNLDNKIFSINIENTLLENEYIYIFEEIIKIINNK